MSEAKDKFQLWLPENKKGVQLPRMRYLQLAHVILSILGSDEEKKVTLTELLEKATTLLEEEKNIAWYLLQVKLDLQARGIIIPSINRDKVQEIHLNTRKVRRSDSLQLDQVIKERP